jgi:hyaluronan synthase
VICAALLTTAGLGRHAILLWSWPTDRPLAIAWTMAFAFASLQWLLSWRDRPWVVTGRDDARLARLRVTVSVPVYNEDPAVLDRSIWALACQDRPPQRIDIVDDGSTIAYPALREHWEGWHGHTEIRWIRQPNAGKKQAQAVTFTSDAQADIFVTVDSDTALERSAIAEGLKPFATRSVMSVAGVELAFNSRVNWLTRTVSARSLVFQVIACGAQSSFGDILVNRGAYALYRAHVLRAVVPAYLGETFLGHPVKLGDDAALTLFARGRGRAVQQSSAFALTMYPETISHHLRQWLRWMRGSTIRNCWRMRYLPATSYGWWFTVIGTYLFLASSALPLLIAVTWPLSEQFAEYGALTMFAWSYLMGLRILAVRRSDEGWLCRAGSVLAFPAAVIWSTLVLRPVRLYGMVTCLRQGWKTRAKGAEVTIAPARDRVPA